jgi:LysM repeat protein
MTIIKKALLLGCLLLLPCTAAAQEKPRIYTIKKGDTLWGISQRFIKDPYYWPSLWSHNPFVKNPHFVYPGQKVAIYDGKLVFLPVEGEMQAEAEPDVETSAGISPEALPLPEPQEEITVKITGSAAGFIGPDDLASAGTLVDTTDARLLMAENDRVFVEIEDSVNVQPGDLYSLIEVGKKIKHPITGRALGYQTSILGEARISEVRRPVATADIVSSEKEIMRGARLIPSLPRRMEVVLKKADRPLTGYVVTGEEEKLALSQHDVIFVDLGADDGLAEGNLLYITRPRTRTESGIKYHNLPLPDALLGAAVVLDVKSRTAAALVLKSVEAIYVGDRVVTPAD